MNENQGWTIWLTGLPASGKTTLARAIQARLRQYGIVAALLDSDTMRTILSPTSDYSAGGRAAFYRQLTDLTAHLTADGVNVIIAATANRRSYRQRAREQLHPFTEVWVRCALDVCRARDPKHLYQRADSGMIRDLPGVDAPYEPPEAPDLVVDTDQQTPEAAADAVIAGIPRLRHLLLKQFDS
jgi:adenylyl-sulfate kinase